MLSTIPPGTEAIRDSPIPFYDLIDVLMWCIREYLKDAVAGMKVLKRLNRWYGETPEDIELAAEIGREIRESKEAEIPVF